MNRNRLTSIVGDIANIQEEDTIDEVKPKVVKKGRPKTKDRHIHLLVNGEMWDTFKQMAYDAGTTPNQLVNEFLAKALKEKRK